jgi:hypothetical protein
MLSLSRLKSIRTTATVREQTPKTRDRRLGRPIRPKRVGGRHATVERAADLRPTKTWKFYFMGGD